MIPFVRRTVLALLLLACSVKHAGAGDLELETATEQVLGFADTLLSEGEYYRAVTEYRRALFLLPAWRSEERARAVLGAGRAYYLGEEFARAGEWLTAHLHEAQGTSTWVPTQQTLYRSLLRSGDTGAVLDLASASKSPEGEFYSGLALAHERRWTDAQCFFENLPADHDYSDAARHNIGVLAEAARGPYKHARLAGRLAVVPGMGYLYAGHKQSALTAFLLNSLLITGSVQAFRSEQYTLGGFTGFLALTWYAGSIYGSVLAAERYNDRRAESYLDRLRD